MIIHISHDPVAHVLGLGFLEPAFQVMDHSLKRAEKFILAAFFVNIIDRNFFTAGSVKQDSSLIFGEFLIRHIKIDIVDLGCPNQGLPIVTALSPGTAPFLGIDRAFVDR